MEFGGQDITAYIRKLLSDQQVSIDFFDAKFIKEKLSFIRLDKDADDNVHMFELPDGTEIQVSNKLLGDASELLFTNPKSTPRGLSAQVYDSLKMCDEVVMPDLSNNIIISGGMSMTAGLGDRLDADINAKFASDEKSNVSFKNARVIPSLACKERGYTVQRKYGAWVGGSILSSLELYHKLKITRQEWEECGENCLFLKYL